MTDVKIDLGCGNARRDGYLGLDFIEGPQVDHVLDLTNDRYPFDDDSVGAVFSAHFLEHIEEPDHVFSEIGRVCRDGAQIEFWTPYTFTEEAFLYGHLHGLTEEQWMHFCVLHRDVFTEMLGGRWLLRNIDFVVSAETEADLRRQGVPMDFAVKYLKGVVVEFGVTIEFRRDVATPAVLPERTWSTTRFGERRPLTAAPEAAGSGRSVAHRVARKVQRVAVDLHLPGFSSRSGSS